jgi:hypothetical protein
LAVSAGIIGAHATKAVAIGAGFTVRLVAYGATAYVFTVPAEDLLARIASIVVLANITEVPVTPMANEMASTVLAKVFFARGRFAVK